MAAGTPPSRPTVVSLLSSATETIYQLGLEAHLIGRSHESDYPPACLDLPICSIAQVDTLQHSSAIDAQVKDLSENGAPTYSLASDVIKDLAPDIVVVQDACRICAVSPKELACTQMESRTVVLLPKTIADVLANVIELADALGQRQRGLDCVAGMERRLDHLPKPDVASPPKVAVIEWIDPLMSCGHWIPELISHAGGKCVPAIQPGSHTAYLTASELLAANPEHVIIAACGFDVSRSAREIAAASLETRSVLLRLVKANVSVWVAGAKRGTSLLCQMTCSCKNLTRARTQTRWQPLLQP